ncbi:putative COMPASS (Complex proteins associated with Set1p) component shg1 [Lyophyllum shimeji]|uniref:COMPASS (Complex proteins associated with Set1p) component shg1 n=1 Tax=Lyophyllum shimeji TaxID=47721 RepID=A0A9P3PCF8_LYOSH|nr:putative COMPASS (Complex proteins associated with Set1p) component shg1 [Lyophyllum shimeji]
MPIDNPTQLVNEFKKSGEFDRLRRELLAQVSQGDGIATLKARVEQTAQERFTSDLKLSFMPPEAIHRELMQEMERFPIVDRVAEDVQMLSEPAFAEGIRKSVHNILLESKGQKPKHAKDEKSEMTATASAAPSTNHPSTAPTHPEQTLIPRPSVAVTPNSQSFSVKVNTPPPNTTPEAPPQALERSLETTKPGVVPAAAKFSGVSEPPVLATNEPMWRWRMHRTEMENLFLHSTISALRPPARHRSSACTLGVQQAVSKVKSWLKSDTPRVWLSCFTFSRQEAIWIENIRVGVNCRVVDVCDYEGTVGNEISIVDIVLHYAVWYAYVIERQHSADSAA